VSQVRGRAQPSGAKKAVFLVVANLLVASFVFVIGEFAMRWRLEGGPVAGLRSLFVSRASPGYAGTDTWLVHDEQLGYKLNPAKEGVNSLGIRHGEISPQKPEDLFRVVVLGDSVAWDADGFVSLLRERLSRSPVRPVEVINAAIPGYTTYQERRLLERDLLPLKPDLVILQYCLNDNHRFLHLLNEAGNWLITPEAKRALTPEGSGVVAGLMRSSYLLLGIRVRLLAQRALPRSEFPWEHRPDFCVAWQDWTWPEFAEHLLAMRDQLANLDARLAVVMVPFEPQLSEKLLALDRTYTLKPQRMMEETCRRTHTPLLDLHAPFIRNRHRELFRDGIHLTPAAHELVARELLDFLDRERLTVGRGSARRGARRLDPLRTTQ
jgi:lysophospholipase L1-like esterase